MTDVVNQHGHKPRTPDDEQRRERRRQRRERRRQEGVDDGAATDVSETEVDMAAEEKQKAPDGNVNEGVVFKIKSEKGVVDESEEECHHGSVSFSSEDSQRIQQPKMLKPSNPEKDQKKKVGDGQTVRLAYRRETDGWKFRSPDASACILLV